MMQVDLEQFTSSRARTKLQHASNCFEELGVIHQTTAPFCPETNGKVEREMRTLKDTARTMLCQAKLPQFLWAEAIACTTYIHNRILNTNSNEVTAYQQIFKTTPSLRHVRVFGCKAYAQVPKEKRQVWDPKAKQYILVGYESYSKKYRLYDSQHRCIIMARNVTFDENEVEMNCSEENPKPWIDSESDSEDDEVENCDSTEENDDEDEDDNSAENDESTEGEIETAETDDENIIPREDNVPIPDKGNATHQPGKKIGVLKIATKDGKFRIIPGEGTTTFTLPKKILRNRATLKAPERYQANFSSLCEEPGSFKEAIASKDKEKWITAIKEEIASLEEKKTFIIIPKPANAKLLDGRWIFKIKRNADGSIERYKARLVIKGYKQQFGVDFGETFASVCRYESIRLLFAITAAYGLKMKQFDVKTAFLNGELEEEIFMTQPEGVNDGHPDNVWLLKKPLYGLKQAPRCWNKRITSYLETLGFMVSHSDPSVFIASSYSDMVYLVLYVDDGLIISSNNGLLNEILEKIGTEFEIKCTPLTKFVGMQIELNERSGDIGILQSTSILDLMKRFNMEECNPTTVPMQPNLDLVLAVQCDESFPFRELIGSLLFIARTTRPNIAYAVAKLAQFTCGFNEIHWKVAKGILRYLKGTLNDGIVYRRNEGVILKGYSDSDYAGDKTDRKSTTGFVFQINDAPISWCSQKQPVVAVSSTEAEYVALAAAAKEAVWMRQFLNELNIL
jgi:hypothetical protein